MVEYTRRLIYETMCFFFLMFYLKKEWVMLKLYVTNDAMHFFADHK